MNKLFELSVPKTFFDTKIATIFDLHNNCDIQANHAVMRQFIPLAIIADKKKIFQNYAAYTILKLTSFNPHVCRKEFDFVPYTLRLARSPQTKRTTMAPTTAPMSPAPSPGEYHPSACPRKPATTAPTMPRIVVNTKPEGSFLPGMMNLAITPATNPMMIVQMMPMAYSYEGLGNAERPQNDNTPTAIPGRSTLARTPLRLGSPRGSVGVDAGGARRTSCWSSPRSIQDRAQAWNPHFTPSPPAGSPVGDGFRPQHLHEHS